MGPSSGETWCTGGSPVKLISGYRSRCFPLFFRSSETKNWDPAENRFTELTYIVSLNHFTPNKTANRCSANGQSRTAYTNHKPDLILSNCTVWNMNRKMYGDIPQTYFVNCNIERDGQDVFKPIYSKNYFYFVTIPHSLSNTANRLPMIITERYTKLLQLLHPSVAVKYLAGLSSPCFE